MKAYTLILFILMNAVLQAADTTAKKNTVSGGIVINDSLQKLMAIDGVQPIYDTCQKNYEAATENQTEKVLDCLWKGVKSNTQLKKKVQEVYAAELKGGGKKTDEKDSTSSRAPASTSSQMSLTGRNASIATDYETDPAVVALNEFYGKKLDAILNPDVALTAEERKSNTILSVDHRQFIDLYKSELGKTIISAFTSFCLDTDPSTCHCTQAEQKACAEGTSCKCNLNSCTISDDPAQVKKDREANLKSLKIADLKTGSADAQKWNMCILSVTQSCTDEKRASTTTMSENTKRSCLVMDYVASARKNIMVADIQKGFYDELQKTQSTNIASNMKGVTDLKVNSSDALLEMSSNDVKTALDKPMNSKLKELEGCYKDGVIVNAKACEAYLNTNKDETNTALAELGMRQIAQEGILEEQLSSSDENVRSYLKEEGYTAEQIKTMTADKEGIEEVKKQILERYAAQKVAIIKEMAARIADKTTATDGKVDASKDTATLAKIKSDMESRSSDLQSLVYFNNVVSSYLEISDDKGGSSRNTASLFAEANSLEAEQAKLLKNQIKSADLKDQKGAANTTNLDVDTINKAFLNYEQSQQQQESSK